MSYARLEAMGGIQWPCPDESHPGTTFLHARLWDEPRSGMAAPFAIVTHEGPKEKPDGDYPLVLTTGRRLAHYNTGVQTIGYDSPLHNEETIDLSPEDAASLGVANGDHVRVSSRRGTLVVAVHIDDGLRAGMVFMTLHSPDSVMTNLLTNDASDPKSGTSEFKACAVKVEKMVTAGAL